MLAMLLASATSAKAGAGASTAAIPADAPPATESQVASEPSAGFASTDAPAASATAPAAPEMTFSLGVNPLGLLQVGPSVEAELFVLPNLSLVGLVRWHGVGVLSKSLTEGLEPGALAYGGNIRGYFGNGAWGAFFASPWYQYGSGTWKHDNQKGEFAYVAYGGEFGYRWKLRSFDLAVGLLTGAYQATKDEYTEDCGNSICHEENDLSTVPIAMLELIFSRRF